MFCLLCHSYGAGAEDGIYNRQNIGCKKYRFHSHAQNQRRYDILFTANAIFKEKASIKARR